MAVCTGSCGPGNLRLDNPDFGAIARAIGLFGVRVENADELEGGLQAAFDHDGPALVDVLVDREELALPPRITLEQIKGFSLFATRTILSGQGNELIELAKTNLRQLARE
jgi:pyruvate dehydrogenase (quinone)